MTMPTRNCERCERPLPMGLGVCPHCGARQTPDGLRRSGGFRLALAIALAVAILAIAHRLSAR